MFPQCSFLKDGPILTVNKSVSLMALCVFALAGMVIHQAFRAPSMEVEEFGSGTAPMVVAIALIVLAVVMVVQEISEKAAVDSDAEGAPVKDTGSQIVNGVLLAIGLAAYVVLLEVTDIPFWILSLFFLVVAARIIEGQMRKWLLPSVVISAVLAIAIEVVFSRFLLVTLP